MPRTADHDARRRQMTDAVRELLADAGFEAVTIAAVARRAGVSVGLVQHYFASKDDLLVATHQATLDVVDARVAGQVKQGEEDALPIRRMLHQALPLYLPLDAERRTDQAVRLALLVRSGTGAAARELAAAHQASLRARLEQVVRNGMRCGEVDAGADAAGAAHELVALLGGLSDQLFVEPGFAAEARALLDDAVVRTFAHPCRRAR